MTVTIPDKSSKQWSPSQRGDQFGNIVRSRGINLNRRGYMSLARKPIGLYSTDDDADFDPVLAINFDENGAYVVTTEEMFTVTFGVTGVTVTKQTTGSRPTFGNQSDACFYNGVYHASGTTMVCSFASGTWTSRITGLSASFPHPLCVSEHQQYLAVGNGNSIPLYSSADYTTAVTTLVIPPEYVVTWIRWRGNLLYVGGRNIKGGEGRMFLWNGAGTAAQAGYPCGSDWMYSACEYESSIAVVTSAGLIRRFNGSGFDTLAEFPIYNSEKSWASNASSSNLTGRVTSRGMSAKGKRLYVNVDNTQYLVGGGLSINSEDFPSGIWVFDAEVGLYHRSGYANKKYFSTVTASMASSTLTLTDAAIYETGDPVLVSVGSLTGIVTGQVYYAIKLTTTTMKLALTPKLAKDGTSLTLGGTPNSFDFIVLDTYRGVGSIVNARAGAVAVYPVVKPNDFYGTEILFGGTTDNNLGVDKSLLMSLGMGKGVGSFTTPKIPASQVTDIFQKFFTKFPKMNFPSQRIALKYRIMHRPGIPAEGVAGGNLITWVNSTSFTVNPLFFNIQGCSVGDEIEFTGGAAAGYTAHITQINSSSSPYVITIDEAMPDVAASDRSDMCINNWTKYKTATISGSTEEIKAALIGIQDTAVTQKATWIQVKVEIRGWSGLGYWNDFEELTALTAQDQKYA